MRYVLLACVICVAAAELGVSVPLMYQPVPLTPETYGCFRGLGASFAVVEVLEPCTGTVLSAAASNIEAAKAAGLTVEVFLNPCMPCMNGTAQATAVAEGVGNDVDFIWAGQYSGCANPSNDFNWNHQFASSIVETLVKAGNKVGVNGESWSLLMGSWTGLKDYPLWYAGDAQPDFKDFQSFGGWTHPAMKTLGSNLICNVTVSRLYRD